VRAACDARDEGAEILILARTDARTTHGLDEALWRLQAFADCGADILFMEAPRDESEMAAFCRCAPQPKLANMLEEGVTPILPPPRLQSIGYKIAAYPLTLLSSAVHAMRLALADLAQGRTPDGREAFESLKRILGFPEYDALLRRYNDGT
jgi:2-methylisocitrate lyase-like PEP mutase family enzyme